MPAKTKFLFLASKTNVHLRQVIAILKLNKYTFFFLKNINKSHRHTFQTGCIEVYNLTLESVKDDRVTCNVE